MTHKQTQQSIRTQMRKLITEDNPQLRVKLETRDAKGRRCKLYGTYIVSGWANDFATVCSTHQPSVQYEFAWSTVWRAITNSTPLIV